jgi:hypothetical protein
VSRGQELFHLDARRALVARKVVGIDDHDAARGREDETAVGQPRGRRLRHPRALVALHAVRDPEDLGLNARAGGAGDERGPRDAREAAVAGEPEAAVSVLEDREHHVVVQTLARGDGGEPLALEMGQPASGRADPEISLASW